LNSFDEFSALTALPAPKTQRARAALMRYVEAVAQKYFEVTTSALRRYDKHHLILGNRIAFDAPEAAWRWAGKTCDIVSFNIYPRVDFSSGEVLGLSEHLNRAHRLTARPIMVTEWSFPALDAHDSSGRALPSLHGAGMRVDTQSQKSRAFALMQAALFRTPFVVGSSYFMWADEPALGISSSFPEDSNYGLVDENDEAYREVTAAARLVNVQAVALHLGASWHPPAALQIKLPAIPRVTASKVLWSGENNEIALENGALRLQNRDGRLLISARDGENWIELGLYSLMLQERVEGQNHWVNAERIESMITREKSLQRVVFDIVFGAGPTSNSMPLATVQSWRGAARLTIEAGRPYLTSRCLWIENSGARSLDWEAYYHYTPSQIGGEGKDDTLAIPDAPNYWLPGGAWRDAARGWQFGAVPARGTDEAKMHTGFWRDENGGQHPDTSRKVESHLAPGARWTAPSAEPSLIIFGLRETPDNRRPWAALALSTK